MVEYYMLERTHRDEGVVRRTALARGLRNRLYSKLVYVSDIKAEALKL